MKARERFGVEAWAEGAVLGSRYRLYREVGEGSHGWVWEAEDTRLGRRVALKVLRPSLDIRLKDRLIQEGRIMSRLEGTGAVGIHGRELLGGFHVLVCEFVGEGRNLRDEIEAGNIRSLTEWEAILAFHPAVKALGIAHEKGVLHRDIKPSNLLWDGASFRVCDFGMASDMEDRMEMTLTGEFVGSHGYASPQVQEGAVPSTEDDVFSMGVSITEALLGIHPFHDRTSSLIRNRIIRKEFSPGVDFSRIDGRLRAILYRALEADPSRRYRTGMDLAEDLRVWLDGGEPSAVLPNALQRSRRWVTANPLLAALLIVLATTSMVMGQLMSSARASRTGALSSLEALQGILRASNTFAEPENRGSLGEQLASFEQVLKDSNGLPEELTISLWESLAFGYFHVEKWDDAGRVFARLRKRQGAEPHLVMEVWCMIETSNAMVQDSDLQDRIRQHALALIRPLAEASWSGDAHRDAWIALARNRNWVLQLHRSRWNPDAASDAVEAFQGIDASLAENDKAPPWARPVNLMNLGTAFTVERRFALAIKAFENADRIFDENGIAGHPERVFVSIGLSNAYKELKEEQEFLSFRNQAVSRLSASGRRFTPLMVTTLAEIAIHARLAGREEECHSNLLTIQEVLANPQFEGDSRAEWQRVRSYFDLAGEVLPPLPESP